jgi:hypothetical protein
MMAFAVNVFQSSMRVFVMLVHTSSLGTQQYGTIWYGIAQPTPPAVAVITLYLMYLVFPKTRRLFLLLISI